ncbi:hypothetical protein NQZ93_04115 [Streptococcus suis]|nr:hypothetical protein NQZ93_04115 [Streptococcus suis]
MRDLQNIIEKQFQQLSLKRMDDSNLNRELEEISYLKKEIARLSQYEYEHRLLTECLANCLLQGRMRMSHCPRELRIKEEDLFYTYAWRFVEAKKDVQSGIELLELLNEDITYFVSVGTLSINTYSYWIEKWLSFLQRGTIAFKGDNDFECYFQKQKEANRSLFSNFGL